MELMYNSTRNNREKVKASEAILRGLATDGGLYVPDFIPHLDKTIDELVGMNYKETAYEVMKLFFTDFTKEELMKCIDNAYDDKFDVKDITQIVRADGQYYLELFHGKTIAFKDMALSILPHLLITSAKKNNVKNDIVILNITFKYTLMRCFLLKKSDINYQILHQGSKLVYLLFDIVFHNLSLY